MQAKYRDQKQFNEYHEWIKEYINCSIDKLDDDEYTIWEDSQLQQFDSSGKIPKNKPVFKNIRSN